LFFSAKQRRSGGAVMIERSDFAAGIWHGFGPTRISPGPARYPYDHAPIQRRFFQPRTYVMSTNHAAAGLILKMITIRLHPDAGQHDSDARYELALNALATALIVANTSVSPAWTVQPVPGDDPLLYSLTPLQEHSVSVTAAWEMIDALLRQVGVVSVEPTFVMLRDAPGAAGDTL
jgi:hypothetical protein